jgi:ribonuclease Z
LATLTILGSSNAIPDETHNNAHLALHTKDRLILIDCVNNQLLRLRKAGLAYQDLTDMILTHFHPDHVSGVPTLLMNLWLLGRQRSLNIFGLGETIDKLSAMMDLFDWGTWPNFYPVALHRIGNNEMTQVLENDAIRIYASPVYHLIPTLGLRIEALNGGLTLAYSCDTEPCPAVIGLAQNADYLIHESTGAYPGHSTASQAGKIARRSGAKALYLIHYPTGDFDTQAVIKEAQQSFNGPVSLAEDYLKIELGE